MTTSPILVTGGTGTLGRLVVRRLKDAGRDVRVLSRSSREAEEGIESVAVTTRRGPIRMLH
jgi:nucleoside-diphosphate-sugar epimerase